jgi:hypothetical protein
MEEKMYAYVLKMDKENEEIKFYVGTAKNVEKRIE